MNCTTANKLSIAGFLTSKGFRPVKHTDNSFTYCSPLRNEKTASFRVDRIKNLWYDFGTGMGGRLIDLVCELYKVEVAGALLILSGESRSIQPFSFDKQLIKSSPLIIEKVRPIQAYYLLQYLKERGIPYYISSRYAHEVHFTINEKKLFTLGFKNDLGGWELRNKFYKGSTSPKAITTIPGTPDTLNIFEGFMDFLSCLTQLKTYHLKGTTIVLNSLSLINKVIYDMGGFGTINLFLDNDQAGEKHTKQIQNLYPHAVDQAKLIYPCHKDFNEFLNKL